MTEKCNNVNELKDAIPFFDVKWVLILTILFQQFETKILKNKKLNFLDYGWDIGKKFGE